MYQAIWYDFKTYEYTLRDDADGWSTFKHKPTLYIESKNGEYETLDGKRVSIAQKVSDWKNPKYYEKDVDKLTRVIVDYYHQTDDIPSFHNLVYLDIECEIGGALTEESIKSAATKITSIALYDNNSKSYICFILDEGGQLLDTKEGNKEIISCIDETELLKKFLTKWRKLDPTIISGWNCIPVNQSVWLNDRITEIGDISFPSEILKYGNIKNISPVFNKKEFITKLCNGSNIKSSKEHIFPYYFKPKEKYKNENTLLNNKGEDTLENIISLSKDNDIFLRIEKGENNNPNLNYGKLCSELGIDCNIDPDIEISNNDLRLLGLLFTDGSISKTKQHCYISNSDDDLIKKYIPLINKYRRKPILFENLVPRFNKLSTKGNFILNFTRYNNNLNKLVNLIWINDKKKINKKLLSLLSYDQFTSFINGILDGDRCISKGIVSLCNYEGNIPDIYELLLWNGVSSYIWKNNNSLSIPYSNIKNKKFLDNLELWSEKRQNVINNLVYKEKRNTIAKNIRRFQYDDFDLVKIESIIEGEEVKMMDIETSTHYYITSGIKTHNSEFFDMPYLYHRISKVLGEDYALKLSPINKVRVNEQKDDNIYTKDLKFKSYVELGCVNHFDYMFLFKKYIMKQESSYALGNIGQKYVKLGKIEYNGSLDKLFRDDPKKFIEYNLRDVEILVELEAKFMFIDLAVLMCHICHTSYKEIFWSTKLNEGAILTYLKRRDIVSPNKPTTYDPSLRNQDKDETYAGGYLLDPKPGLYAWLIDNDYSSLYPSIIRSLNLGIETYLGQILDRQDKYDCWWGLDDLKEKDPKQVVTIENKQRQTKEITIGELVKMIETNHYTIAASGAMFRTDKLSITAEILGDWFAMRKQFKKKMKEAYLSGDKDKGDHYHRTQHSLKILLNSLYGNYAITSWRYSDGRKILSQAITLSGQRLVKESIKLANEYIDNEIQSK